MDLKICIIHEKGWINEIPTFFAKLKEKLRFLQQNFGGFSLLNFFFQTVLYSGVCSALAGGGYIVMSIFQFSKYYSKYRNTGAAGRTQHGILNKRKKFLFVFFYFFFFISFFPLLLSFLPSIALAPSHFRVCHETYMR